MTRFQTDPAGVDVDPDTFGRALLAANVANPGELLDQMRAQFLELPGAVDLVLHLIDYRLFTLRPVEAEGSSRLLRPEPVADSPLGESFRLQQPTSQPAPAGQLHHTPVSVRGQRLGVLTGTFADAPSPGEHRALRSLALAVAYSLLEASAGTDVFELSRRHGSLSLAAEMQWQLLPARAYQTSHFYVAGHLEPALRVAGDAFDFVVNDNVLTLAVIDAAGTGGAPSVLTTLVVTALRNARRSGLDLSEQASLAGDIVWQHSGGAEHASALLMQLDARTGRAVVVDAGSPAVLRMRDGNLEPQPFEQQTPLGMFDGTVYRKEAIEVRAGDRAYVLTDGAFSEGRTLAQIMQLLASDEHGANQAPPESIRQLVAALTSNGEEPEDDITVLCVDWTQ